MDYKAGRSSKIYRTEKTEMNLKKYEISKDQELFFNSLNDNEKETIFMIFDNANESSVNYFLERFNISDDQEKSRFIERLETARNLFKSIERLTDETDQINKETATTLKKEASYIFLSGFFINSDLPAETFLRELKNQQERRKSEKEKARELLEELNKNKLLKLLNIDKIRATLERELTPQELESFKTDPEAFLINLSLYEFLKIVIPEIIPNVKSKLPEKYVTTKDRITKLIFGEIDNKSIINVQKDQVIKLWENKRNKKNVTVYANIDTAAISEAMKAAGITVGTRNLSNPAKEVFAACLSLQLAGNNYQTINQIGNIIFSTSEKGKLTPKQKKYITQGLKEIFLTPIYINTKAKGISKNNQALAEIKNVEPEYAGPMYPGEFAAFKINGNYIDEYSGVVLYNLPPLYRLQKALDPQAQILTVPRKLLVIPGRTDEDLINIRAYMLRRIDAMNHSPNASRTILFNSLLKQLNIDPGTSTRKKKSTILDKARRVLDYWKDQGYIKNYIVADTNGAPLTSGKKAEKIIIKLAPVFEK